MSVLTRRALATGIGTLAAGGGLVAVTQGYVRNPFERRFASPGVDIAFATPAASFVNRIGLDLLARMVAKDPNANSVLAPGSVVAALAMAAAGTSGTTRAALAQSLAAETNGQIGPDDMVERLGALERAL